MTPLPWLCPLDPPYNAVGNSVFAVGGGADDTASLLACISDCVTMKKKMYMPGGYFFRVTQDMTRTATVSGFQRGLSIFGDGMLDGGIVADYNGDAVKGGVLRFDCAGGGMYTVDSVLEHFNISQVPGRTGLNGIQLTAAWEFSSDRVKIYGMSNHGYAADLRTDINLISDFYQDFAVTIHKPWVEVCGVNGFDFSAGQSPGVFTVSMGQIISCGKIGLRTTTGQCRIMQNVISYHGAGGLSFETAEGPSMVGIVEQNEIQDSLIYGVNLVRSRDLRLIGNRFLSQTYSNRTMAAAPQNGGPFMRQFVHVNLGSGAGGEVYNLLAEGNLHRTVNGSIATTASCYGYDASGGSLSASFPCRFIKNDFGPWAPDGITQNSTAFVKFAGSMPGAVIVDP